MHMGVTVVTPAGPARVSRVGFSLLHNGLVAACVARTADAFVEKAARLAGDWAALRYVREMEAALVGMAEETAPAP